VTITSRQEAVSLNHQRLTQLRLAAQLTQFELAVRAGVRPETVSRIESGQTPTPTTATVQALARVLGVPLVELLAEPEGAATFP
jgi:transcriptional regulator with XRE-family HTH domain